VIKKLIEKGYKDEVESKEARYIINRSFHFPRSLIFSLFREMKELKLIEFKNKRMIKLLVKGDEIF
jgi:hypothetical protein